MRFRGICIGVLIILFFPLLAPGQSKHEMDSVYNVLKTAKEDSNKFKLLTNFFEYITLQGDYKKSDSIGHLALELAEKLKRPKDIGSACLDLGLLCNEQGNYSEALKYQTRSVKVFQEIGFKRGLANAYLNIGAIYDNLGNYPEALKNHLQCLKLAEEIGSKRTMAKAYINLGNVYQAIGNYSEALNNQLKGLDLDRELGNKHGMGIAYTNIGSIYMQMKNYPEAIKNQLEALKIKEAAGSKPGIGIAHSGLGDIYMAIGNYTEALANYKQSLGIAKEISDSTSLSLLYSDFANIYIKQKLFPLAKSYIDSALSIGLKTGQKDALEDIYYRKAKLDSLTNNYSEAFKDYKSFIVYRDSLKNNENTKKIVSEQMQFEFDKKQSEEKAEQDKKDAIAAQESKKQLIIRNSFIAGFVLVLALAFFIFRGYRQKQKANEIIVKQKQEVELQKNIVEEKQKEILDSIHYAQRIQKALLASDTLLNKNLPEYFVLYKPKDIVSGDFYWATQKDDKFYLAVCDSTGHGVPGAFMSLLNTSFLNEAINEKNIMSPNEVFNHTRKRLIENISQDGQQDGMDGVLISLATGKFPGQMAYAVAYNAPVIVRNGEVIELSADKLPVGKSPKESESFNLHSFNLQKGDIVYAFTDGFADQFGGEKGKKFKYRQLLQLIKDHSQLSMQEQKKALEQTFEEWKGNLEQVDDVLVVGIRI